MEYTSKISSICYKEDIIKEMSLELNIPEKEIKEIIDLNLKYIKKNVIEQNCLIINLPNLCKLRMNYKLALGSFYRGSSDKSLRNKSLKIKIDLLEEYRLKNGSRLSSFKNPLYERLWRKMKRIKYNKYTYKKMYDMIKEVEDETNTIINKIE